MKWDEARSPVTSLNWTFFPAIDPNQKSGPHFPSCPCLCARSQPASATVTAAHSTDKTVLRDWRMQRIKQLLLFSFCSIQYLSIWPHSEETPVYQATSSLVIHLTYNTLTQLVLIPAAPKQTNSIVINKCLSDRECVFVFSPSDSVIQPIQTVCIERKGDLPGSGKLC